MVSRFIYTFCFFKENGALRSGADPGETMTAAQESNHKGVCSEFREKE